MDQNLLPLVENCWLQLLEKYFKIYLNIWKFWLFSIKLDDSLNMEKTKNFLVRTKTQEENSHYTVGVIDWLRSQSSKSKLK